MKKFFSLVAALVCTLGALAAEYTGQLTVQVNDDVTRQETTITLEQNEDGTYTFSLKNFVLDAGTQKLGVGNIILPNLEGDTAFGYTNISYNGGVTITDGDDPNVNLWIGKTLGSVPIDMNTAFNADVISVNIDIELALLGQTIKVRFIGTTPKQGGGSADTNGDGTVDVEDVNKVINAILGKE